MCVGAFSCAKSLFDINFHFCHEFTASSSKSESEDGRKGAGAELDFSDFSYLPSYFLGFPPFFFCFVAPFHFFSSLIPFLPSALHLHHFLPRYPITLSFCPFCLCTFLLPFIICLPFWFLLSSYHLSFLKMKYHKIYKISSFRLFSFFLSLLQSFLRPAVFLPLMSTFHCFIPPSVFLSSAFSCFLSCYLSSLSSLFY